ncbi:MAG: helix-turn-helix transcriptional regulator, partial [Clostridiales bacterium]|nr:helix-turn-helix transcriptional regulator [Clostridiales bacterium]
LSLIRISEHGSVKNKPFSNPQLQPIASAIDYISSNYMHDVSVEHIAQLCHMSTSHFRRVFKDLMGWSPLDYVQTVRIDKACALLYDCNLSVTEIGIQVGFSTPSSFGRQFKKRMGMSPSQWRIKIQNEENPIVTAYFKSIPPHTSTFVPPSALD